jgi:hypothetical protein
VNPHGGAKAGADAVEKLSGALDRADFDHGHQGVQRVQLEGSSDAIVPRHDGTPLECL